MSIRIITLLLALTVVVVSAETVAPDSGKVETQVALVDPFTLEQTPVTIVMKAEPMVSTKEVASTKEVDYHGTTTFFDWVRNDTASKSLIATSNGDWDWYRPIIVPGRPNHRSPFTPDAEY